MHDIRHDQVYWIDPQMISGTIKFILECNENLWQE